MSISPDSDARIVYVIQCTTSETTYEMFHSCEGLHYIEYPARYDEILYKKVKDYETVKVVLLKFIKRYIKDDLLANIYHSLSYDFIRDRFQIRERVNTKRENYDRYCKEMHERRTILKTERCGGKIARHIKKYGNILYKK